MITRKRMVKRIQRPKSSPYMKSRLNIGQMVRVKGIGKTGVYEGLTSKGYKVRVNVNGRKVVVFTKTRPLMT